jgi:hypothetical protein
LASVSSASAYATSNARDVGTATSGMTPVDSIEPPAGSKFCSSGMNASRPAPME